MPTSPHEGSIHPKQLTGRPPSLSVRGRLSDPRDQDSHDGPTPDPTVASSVSTASARHLSLGNPRLIKFPRVCASRTYRRREGCRSIARPRLRRACCPCHRVVLPLFSLPAPPRPPFCPISQHVNPKRSEGVADGVGRTNEKDYGGHLSVAASCAGVSYSGCHILQDPNPAKRIEQISRRRRWRAHHPLPESRRSSPSPQQLLLRVGPHPYRQRFARPVAASAPKASR